MYFLESVHRVGAMVQFTCESIGYPAANNTWTFIECEAAHFDLKYCPTSGHELVRIFFCFIGFLKVKKNRTYQTPRRFEAPQNMNLH